jgi:putative hydrolase of HD superfamily
MRKRRKKGKTMPISIRKGLLQFVFSGAYMKRWNDKLRPMELIEIDKQAHKMIVAWLLCRLSGRNLSPPDRLSLEAEVVEGGIFDYLFRLVITDIKPPILYRIKENPEHYRQLAEWAMAEAEPHTRSLGEEFWERFCAYVARPKPEGRAAEILAAAHQYASAWEFRLLSGLNAPFDEETRDIARSFLDEISLYRHLPGVEDLLSALRQGDPSAAGTAGETLAGVSSLAKIANLCGQLRFQKRWSQTPRTPETSVMGHMFIVACYAYFLSIAVGACRARRVNNLFTGLFHDVPELLTRDIISPVKKSSERLASLIRAYEEGELSRRVLGPLRADGYADIAERLGYYLGLEVTSEFATCIMENGRPREISFEDLHKFHNEDRHDPKDGEAVKICDILAAYIEAYTAMRNGITSDHIQQAFWRMREQNAKRVLGPLRIGPLFTDFD